ncbi:hypothetical protein FZCC0188_11620 [Rhodobacterales bacterium FZCC0188]|nr:hypothetical protein [Rhodobacterales bacterium FZCC0188]
MIFYQTGSQKLAGELVATYISLNEKKYQDLDRRFFFKFTSLLKYCFFNPVSDKILLPYFGAFFKGIPVLETLFIIKTIFKPEGAIIYYGDGFLVRGRQNHLLPLAVIKKIINLFEKKVKVLELYLVDLGYPSCCEESQQVYPDFIIDCLIASPDVPKFALPEKHSGKLVVIPMFKSLIHSRFDMVDAVHYWTSVIKTCAKKFVEHTFVLIPHPVDPPSLAESIQTELEALNVVFYNGIFENFYIKNISRIDFVAPTSLGCVSFLNHLGSNHIAKCRLYDQSLISSITSNCRNQNLINYLEFEINRKTENS